MKIEIKPISVNRCWQGRRYKTKEYAEWRREFGYLIPARSPKLRFNESLALDVVFGLKYPKKADLDNFIKPFLDACVENGIIQDDRLVYEIIAKKVKTDGKEYIAFNFYPNLV